MRVNKVLSITIVFFFENNWLAQQIWSQQKKQEKLFGMYMYDRCWLTVLGGKRLNSEGEESDEFSVLDLLQFFHSSRVQPRALYVLGKYSATGR